VKKSTLALIALLLPLQACNPHPAGRASPSPTPPRRPWLHITQSGTARQPLRVVQQRGNRKQYVLVADSSESSGVEGRTIGTFFNAKVTFYGRDGKTLAASGQRAVIDQRADTITLIGDVHARTGTGMRLTCDSLRYDQRSDKLHGEGHVVIADAHGLKATGNVVDSDIALSQTVMQ
jgi:lipopolysaccharide assembly outer membrane protein LptD (OstA)